MTVEAPPAGRVVRVGIVEVFGGFASALNVDGSEVVARGPTPAIVARAVVSKLISHLCPGGRLRDLGLTVELDAGLLDGGWPAGTDERLVHRFERCGIRFAPATADIDVTSAVIAARGRSARGGGRAAEAARVWDAAHADAEATGSVVIVCDGSGHVGRGDAGAWAFQAGDLLFSGVEQIPAGVASSAGAELHAVAEALRWAAREQVRPIVLSDNECAVGSTRKPGGGQLGRLCGLNLHELATAVDADVRWIPGHAHPGHDIVDAAARRLRSERPMGPGDRVVRLLRVLGT